MLFLLFHQRYGTGNGSQSDKDHKDTNRPFCGLSLPLAHIQSGQVQQQVDEGYQRAQQMERLT